MVVSRASWVLCLIVLLAPARSAWAFRCTQATGDGVSADGPSLSWGTRELTFTLQPAGSRSLPTDKTLSVLREAFAVWETLSLSTAAQAQCGANMLETDIHFTELPGSQDANWVGFNFLMPESNTNLLVFRDDAWPPPDPSATGADVIALSTITYSALTGEIIDADIEFNSANFGFSAGDPNGEQMDLLSTAVHEIGHFLGLAHCASSTSCGNGEVMEPTANLGEYDKRLLQCDDRDGLAFKYPKGKPNGYATKVSSLNDIHSGWGTCLPPQYAAQLPTVRQLKYAQGRTGCSQTPLGAEGLVGVAALGLALRRRVRRRPGTTTGLVVLVSSGLLMSCGESPGCDGAPVPIEADGPLILNMGFVGQVSIDPWHVVLRARVVDPDGDLGAGSVSYYVNGSTTPVETQLLERVYNASGGVDVHSTDAELQMLLRFNRSSAPTAALHLGTQVTDGAGHRSNCHRLDLSYLLSMVQNAAGL